MDKNHINLPKHEIATAIPGTTYKLVITSISVMEEDYSAKGKNRDPQLYFWPLGESIMDNLKNRRGRPYKAYETLVPTITKLAGFHDSTKMTWSQYAGCTCPCSPGFKCNAAKAHYKDVRKHVHVHYKVVDMSEVAND